MGSKGKKDRLREGVAWERKGKVKRKIKGRSGVKGRERGVQGRVFFFLW